MLGTELLFPDWLGNSLKLPLYNTEVCIMVVGCRIRLMTCRLIFEL